MHQGTDCVCFYRFYALVNSKHWDPNGNPDINELCKVVLEKYIPDKDKYQIGLTKIFFRAGQVDTLLDRQTSDFL